VCASTPTPCLRGAGRQGQKRPPLHLSRILIEIRTQTYSPTHDAARCKPLATIPI
jgi:hypothetical protein